MNKVGIIILAAGDSSRLGFPKQLLEVDGESLLLRTVKIALMQTQFVVTVLGYNFNWHSKDISTLPVDIEFNLDWNKGIGSTLKMGFNSLWKKNPEIRGVIILAIDQPYVDADLIKSLINLQEAGHELVVSNYANRQGLPALVGRKYFKELLHIQDNETIESLVEIYGAYNVPFPNGVFDIDTEEDWDYFYRSQRNRKIS